MKIPAKDVQKLKARKLKRTTVLKHFRLRELAGQLIEDQAGKLNSNSKWVSESGTAEFADAKSKHRDLTARSRGNRFVLYLASNLSWYLLKTLSECPDLSSSRAVILSRRLRSAGVSKAQIARGLQREAKAALQHIREQRRRLQPSLPQPTLQELIRRRDAILAAQAAPVQPSEKAGTLCSHPSTNHKTTTGGNQ